MRTTRTAMRTYHLLCGDIELKLKSHNRRVIILYESCVYIYTRKFTTQNTPIHEKSGRVTKLAHTRAPLTGGIEVPVLHCVVAG